MTSAEPLRLDFLPWEYKRTASAAERESQLARQARLTGAVELAADVYVAESAAVYCDELRLGERSYIAAHAYVTGSITLGSDSTINPFTTVRGQVTIGDGVRIGAHTSILAFNHGTAPGEPIFRQPHTARGITIADDVWIGSGVTILDGVTIGPHTIIGAGAVVTKPIPAHSIAVGNPARVVRSRNGSSKPVAGISSRLADFAARAREQVDAVLARSWDGERFVDRPGTDLPPAVRPWCDAVEIADLLVRRTPSGHTRDDLVRRLRARQDPKTGLVAPGDLSDAGLDVPSDHELAVLQGEAPYHVLCVGYALQVLGSAFEHPIDTTFTTAQLNNLPWARNAWSAGAAIDALGTAIARNHHDHGESGPLEQLIGWLTINADRTSGAWGAPHPDDGWLQVVNGFYRLTRGTYAQFGLPLPYPEQAVKTVLAHSNDRRMFTGDNYNACNVLDVIHPLWLARRQTSYGAADATRWAEHQLTAILDRWIDNAGFAFAPDGTDTRAVPGLQGTEMWLSVIWLLADYLGHSEALAYRPRGVHRPEPLITL
ncbi:acyltransferase [Kribbella sandramycini]|uniref:Acetyltransferase-like isoleucine patch superfamily enzyme n=1 Tax=Kribbella sandramycini TaxID=60450 RepID=A0A7Y4P3V0_9ACTN|nr:acyltransferase [Kribbella sandramycini]MBB6571840.1 acetyltransferase-like isoleucine patch superfamily enzyme [Kribbella sandramycini]NOL44480.1 acyltransferase [Kribbella sandramycini]